MDTWPFQSCKSQAFTLAGIARPRISMHSPGLGCLGRKKRGASLGILSLDFFKMSGG